MFENTSSTPTNRITFRQLVAAAYPRRAVVDRAAEATRANVGKNQARRASRRSTAVDDDACVT
jgi:hypothetical protein